MQTQLQLSSFEKKGRKEGGVSNISILIIITH
jgi:hypothetical protein